MEGGRLVGCSSVPRQGATMRAALTPVSEHSCVELNPLRRQFDLNVGRAGGGGGGGGKGGGGWGGVLTRPARKTENYEKAI
jgi:hypothetical protein